MRSVHVSVPASTANLGPGFDCLGLALDLSNTVEMAAADGGVEVTIEGEGAQSLPRGSRNLMVRAARRLFDAAGKGPKGLRLRASNHIPLGSGLGSSAAAIVAGLVAADALVKSRLSRPALLQLAYELEGHADNAAAALYGGLNLVGIASGSPLVRQVPIGDLKLVIAVPALQLSTKAMRRTLPRRVPLRDAVFNLGRAVLTVDALRTGDLKLLQSAMADRLHERHRLQHIPAGEAVIAAARNAGAAAVALSGAGPSLIAFASARRRSIARAMARAFESAGIETRTFVVSIDRRGARAGEEGEW